MISIRSISAILVFAVHLINLVSVAEGIVNGQPVAPGEFKFIASMYNAVSKDHICGASILNELWLLTAGHCVYEEQAKNFVVIVGTTNLNDPKTRRSYPVDRFILHPKYVPEVAAKDPETKVEVVTEDPINDIALIKLKEKIKWEPLVQPAPLPATSNLPIDAECHTAGWGATNPDKWEEGSDHLLKMKFHLVKQTECPNLGYNVTATNFCVADKTEKSTPCNGDSGGPVICNGIIYGVASVSGCDPEAGTLYTTVAKYQDFIKQAKV